MRQAPILVTGACGFIGSQFVENVLATTSKTVVVIDKLTYAGHSATLDHAIQAAATRAHKSTNQMKERIEFIKGDIADRDFINDVVMSQKPEAIINFAAESHVDRSIESAAEFVETNIMGVFVLLDTSRRYYDGLEPIAQSKFRLVQVSTDEVFGELDENGYFTEETPYAPNSPYSASKASGDHLVRAWFHTYKLPVIITNCSNNYGPRQFPEKLIPHMIECALRDKPLPVYGEGKNIRDWIHVEDHAKGIELALTLGVPGESYCFGGRSERRNIDVVKSICTILDELKPRQGGGSYLEQISFVTDRKGHDWRYAIDDTKSEKQLGFKRQYTAFEDGLKATIKWYLENAAWVVQVRGQ